MWYIAISLVYRYQCSVLLSVQYIAISAVYRYQCGISLSVQPIALSAVYRYEINISLSVQYITISAVCSYQCSISLSVQCIAHLRQLCPNSKYVWSAWDQIGITYYILFHIYAHHASELIHPSSGACSFSILSPHWSCVVVSMCVGVSVWLGLCGIRVAVWNLSVSMFFVSVSLYLPLLTNLSRLYEFFTHWDCWTQT